MPRFCVPKKYMNNVLESISKLDGQMDTLVNMEGEELTKFFSKTLGEDGEALATEFLRAKASSQNKALADWLRKNTDKEFRVKQIKAQQKRNINNYITRNLYPTKGKRETYSVNEIMKMKNRDEFLSQYYSPEELREVSKKLDEAFEKSLKSKKDHKGVNAQKRVIENLFKKKPIYKSKITKSTDELLMMEDGDRIKFLKKYFKNPEAINTKIKKYSQTPMEKNLRTQLSRDTNIAEINAYMDNKISHVVNEKNKIAVSIEDVNKINKQTEKIRTAKEKWDTTGLEKDRVDYGVEVRNLEELTQEITQERTTKEIVASIFGLPRALMATGEFSAIGMQGYSQIPEVLLRNVKQFGSGVKLKDTQIGKIFKSMFSREQYDRLIADYATRETAQIRKKSKLLQTDVAGEITKREEDFTTRVFDWLEEVPGLSLVGKIGNSFSRFHSAFLTSVRVEAFDDTYKLINIGKDELSDKNAKYLASSINDLTGGAYLGRTYESSGIAKAFFSLKKTIGDIKTFTVRPVTEVHKLAKNTETLKAVLKNVAPNSTLAKMPVDEVEKRIATISLIRLMTAYSMMAGSYGIFKMLSHGNKDVTVEDDPRSADFGDIKIGDTRVGYMGGKDWALTLAGKLWSGEAKSGDVIYEMGTGYGERSRLDEIIKVGRGKLSPNLGLVTDMIDGKNVIGEEFGGGAFTIETMKGVIDGDKNSISRFADGLKREGLNKLSPMSWNSVYEATREEDDELLNALYFVGGMVGASMRTHGYSRDWTSPSKKNKTGQKFLKEFGYKKTKEIGKEYSELVDKKLKEYKKTQEYKELSNKDKIKGLSKISRDTKKEIYKKYNFNSK